MNLSIVLPIYRDDGIEACLASVDEEVEIVAVVNGRPADLDRRVLRHEDAVVVETPRAGLAHACQLGVRVAAHDLVLFMNSDCVFAPGAIRALYEAHQDGSVTVGMVRYTHDTWQSRIVDALNQAQRSHPVHAFQPNLLIDRRLAPRIGGYIFDERLCWTEDADLHRRLIKAGIGIVYCPGSLVVHGAQTLRGFLACAKKYGSGRAEASRLGLQDASPFRLTPRLFIHDFDHNRQVAGLPAAVYGAVWMIAFARAARP